MVIWRRLIIVVCLLFVGCATAAPISDDAGQALNLNRPAHRIISLAPDITEILFAIDAGKEIVGVVKGSNYPAAALSLPQVGSYAGIDLERILSLHPDLIIAWHGTFTRQLAVLKKLGIPVYLTHPRQVEDIALSMKKLGILTGHPVSGEKAANLFLQQLMALKTRYHRSSSIPVFYQIGSFSLITINQDSWINQVIELCGGRNVFAHLPAMAPEIGWEAVIAANPAVIISDASDKNWPKRWERWRNVTAVKNHAFVTVNPDLIERAGPRILKGAQEICAYLANQAVIPAPEHSRVG